MVYKIQQRDNVPLQAYLGVAGMPGRTGYCGLMYVGKPKAGETVVVSAASGPVGTVVGQTAKSEGCRVVGVAGGPEKCNYVVNELGFDACVDYKAGNLEADLKAACPDGIDIYFENVGGAVTRAVAPLLNTGAGCPSAVSYPPTMRRIWPAWKPRFTSSRHWTRYPNTGFSW